LREAEGPPGGGPSLSQVSVAYGSVSAQALRPCVAAYSLRAPGTIVSPATSTFGNPPPAAVQLPLPLASRVTPKSVEAERSPVMSSRTRSVVGRSPIGPTPPSRFVQVAVHAPGLYVTSNTWPGVVGVFALYPEYEIHAWFAFAGST